ncbi:hypothetical protein C8Q79DRAFT_1002431 [Trametes meyenii]|nr:hypothetical protein C8Q79DRAFT_1002431 [Trametes meyenii]
MPPQRDPEANVSLESVCDAPTLAKGPEEPAAQRNKNVSWLGRNDTSKVDKTDTHTGSQFGPFDNASQFRLSDWHYNAASTKSMGSFDDLIDVIVSNGFNPEDLRGFNADSAQARLDGYAEAKGTFSEKDGWREGSVEIPLPKTGEKYPSEQAAPTFTVDGVHYRSLIELICGAAQDTREYEKIRAQPRNPADGPDVEIAICSLLVWSDATHLTNFGAASLWPFYVYLGNLSKYIRGMPTEFAAHHLTYIPSLPDQLKNAYTEIYGVPPSDDVLTFCKRELIQQIWLLLLDEKFMEAYEHGILVECGDGVTRRIFPRFFTYSADYPEKMLLTAVKPLANHPCPRCLISKEHICETGTPEDMERRSETRMDTPGLQLQEFNRRMQNMPTFGVDTIRKFWSDVSARKQLAARDYEDFLIVMIPAFEGLLPLHDDQSVANLLFKLANWHALAKLRLHTEVTLQIFRAATSHVTEAVRHFANTTCEEWTTLELAKETKARVRREERQGPGAVPDRERKIVCYNVPNTPKYHFMPDYPSSIEEIGTTDNGNTQVGELEHRYAKQFYARTNKVAYEKQIAKHMRRASLLRSIRRPHTAKSSEDAHYEPAEEDANNRPDSPLPLTDPRDHYAISKTRRLCVRLRNWLAQNRHDPAAKNFIPLLKDHFASRMLDPDPNNVDMPYSNQQLDGIEIKDDRIYRHKMLRVNYMTYDVRRNQDTIKPNTHPDIMVLADEDSVHLYWYARVLDIFHAHVRYTGPGTTRAMREGQHMDFLWVRWFRLDDSALSGFQARRLPRLSFMDANDPDNTPFGFVDPRDVIRGAHILPAFDHGVTDDLLGPSELARRIGDHDEDYAFYYVSM